MLIIFLFLAAFAVRFYELDTVGFSPLRQHLSAIRARAYFYENNPSIPEWEREVSTAQMNWVKIHEPPLMDHLAAFAYRLAGGERIWIPHLFSILCWLIGGVFLYAIATKIASLDEALLAISVYLFLPFAAIASKAFMPDPPMIMTFLASVFTIVLYYYEKQTLKKLLLASCISGLCIFIKPHCMFLIMGAFLSLAIWDWKKIPNQSFLKIINLRLITFFTLTLLLGVFYYAYSIFKGGNLISVELKGDLHPYLLLKPSFWAGWLAQINIVHTFPIFLGGLVGLLFFYRGFSKALLMGLWGGYFLFGIIDSYPIASHDYYQLPFVPVVALSVAPTFAFILRQLQQKVGRQTAALPLFLLCIFLGMASVGIKTTQYSYDRHARWQRNERRIAEEIGNLVNHSTKIVHVSLSEGLPLLYYGKMHGTSISLKNELLEEHTMEKERWSAERTLDPRELGYAPEYFVITELLEFKRHGYLTDYLGENFPVLARGIDYIIYDLRKRIK